MHPSNGVRRPLNKDLFTMLSSPFIGLGLPMPWVNVEASKVIFPNNLIDCCDHLATRHIATPFSGVPHRRPLIRPIRRSEAVTGFRFQTYSRPVVRERPIHAA